MPKVIGYLQRGGKGRAFTLNGYGMDDWRGVLNGLTHSMSYYWKDPYADHMRSMTPQQMGRLAKGSPWGYSKAGVTPQRVVGNVMGLIKGDGDGAARYDYGSLRGRGGGEGYGRTVAKPWERVPAGLGGSSGLSIGPYATGGDDGGGVMLAGKWSPGKWSPGKWSPGKWSPGKWSPDKWGGAFPSSR